MPLHLALYLANNCQSECGTCGERFCHKPDLGYHLVCHHTGYHNADFRFDPELTCVVCGVRFGGGPGLGHHLTFDHNVNSMFDPELTCAICDVRSGGGPDWAPHIALVHTSYLRC